jgi:glycosyltransferase involved in cell wall biosynthesis
VKVLVLSNRVPFIWGGAEELSFNLVRRLQEAGHQAEEMRIPFSWNPAERLIEEMVIARSLRLANVDRVIALKFPASLIPHDNQVVWLLHQFRQAYDLFDADNRISSAVRRVKDTRPPFARPTNRRFVRHALFMRYRTLPSGSSGTTASMLLFSLSRSTIRNCSPGGDDGAYSGRWADRRRQAPGVADQALAHAPGVRLVVAGPPEDAAVPGALRALAQRCGVADRVTFDLRFLPREELAALVNACTASAYIPFDEDSVGYVTMEAFQAGKPVITSTDSGGVLEIVQDGDTGLVTAPRPETLGQAMARMIADRSRAARLGAAGRSLLAARNITWPKTLERLLG